MDPALEALKNRWAESTAIGLEGDAALGRELLAGEEPGQSASLYAERNAIRTECVAMAQAYVDANKPACEARFGHLELSQLVADVSHYREGGREDDQWATEAWLLATFQPQNIGGDGAIVLKRPGR